MAGTEDEHVSVSEKGTYSHRSDGPREDTDVFAGRSDLAGDAAGVEHRERNRATPNPMSDLRRQLRSTPPAAAVVPEPMAVVAVEEPSPTRRLLPLLLAVGAVMLFMGGGLALIGVYVLFVSTSGDAEDYETLTVTTPGIASPEGEDAELEALPDPDKEVEPEAAKEEEEAREFGGVPVRNGLRGR